MSESCWCYSLKPIGVEGGVGQTVHELKLHERIAELEAKLAKWRRAYDEVVELRAIDVARAEKAEAEVERLTKELDGVIEILTPSQISFLAKRRGGRESGEQSVEGVSRETTSDPRSLGAANPAARKEHDDG